MDVDRRRLARGLAVGVLAVLTVGPPVSAGDGGGADPDVASTTVVEVRETEAGLEVVTRRTGSPAEAAAAAEAARGESGVVAADVDSVVSLAGTVPDGAVDEPAARPEVAAGQWALGRLRAPELWRAASAEGQVIAVVDTGVDGSHPDLAAVTRPGADLVDGGDGRTDPSGHGTHVAGIAAAVADDGVGVSGLAHGAEILPVRVLDASGLGAASDVVEAVIWAVDHGATVVVLSLAGADSAELYREAVRYAERRGVVVVAAAGNQGADAPTAYPAALPGVVGVGATTVDDERAETSSVGRWVEVVAPGHDILSTFPGGGYVAASGTSLAASYAAASAALVRAAAPRLSPAALRARLRRTAEDLGRRGRDDAFGHGLVRPLAAVDASRHGSDGRPWWVAMGTAWARREGSPSWG